MTTTAGPAGHTHRGVRVTTSAAVRAAAHPPHPAEPGERGEDQLQAGVGVEAGAANNQRNSRLFAMPTGKFQTF